MIDSMFEIRNEQQHNYSHKKTFKVNVVLIEDILKLTHIHHVCHLNNVMPFDVLLRG